MTITIRRRYGWCIFVVLAEFTSVLLTDLFFHLLGLMLLFATFAWCLLPRSILLLFKRKTIDIKSKLKADNLLDL